MRMKLPATNPLADLIPNPDLTLRITPPAIPTHEEVVRFIARKGKVLKHAVQSWERLEAEVLAQVSTRTTNSETGSSTEYISATE